jgi:hypothetical protein
MKLRIPHCAPAARLFVLAVALSCALAAGTATAQADATARVVDPVLMNSAADVGLPPSANYGRM